MARTQRRVHIGSDDDSDGDQDSSRRSVRRRLSETHAHAANESSDRTPLTPVNINDDASERRRRRKSTKAPTLDIGANGGGVDGEDADTQMNTLENSRSGRQRPLNSIQPPVIAVSRDVMTSNFEEWMKMATDNKINSSNSFNVYLIDYFHDMSLLRNASDNTINFQRASCTLDGCVKVWTSRVDSVGTETGKLLSNLANDATAEDGARETDEEESDNPDGGSGEPGSQGTRKRSKTHRSGQTIAKDPAQLRSKKLDLEFSVDPLFKKTCADFDEGGAQGLLMNHLSLGFGNDSALRVVFDASDSTGKVEEEDEYEEAEDDIDISFLRSEFLPDLTILDTKAIVPSLEDFSFSGQTTTNPDETAFYPTNAYDDDDDDDFGGGADGPPMGDDGDFNTQGAIGGDAGAEEDFFTGDAAITDDFVDFGAGNGSNDGDDDDQGYGGGGDGSGGAGGGGGGGYDARGPPDGKNLVMAMADPDAEGMFDYFDKNVMKNWAGPHHFKIRRPPPPRAVEGDAAKPKRQKKDPFKIDFLTPSDKTLSEITKELFKTSTRGAGINLPKSKKGGEAEKKNDHRLPDDMHFSSRQLVTLFLKPKFTLKMRGRQVRYNENGDGEVDENFWAQAAADQAANRNAEDEDGADPNVPFNTQFFHEDDDDDDGPMGGFDDLGSSIPLTAALALGAIPEEGEEDLLAGTQSQTRRVKPEAVNYTKRAKRVDVRRLKETIWAELAIPEVGDSSGFKAKGKGRASTARGDDDDEEMRAPDEDEEGEGEGKKFQAVIDGLSKSYPPDKMKDISTSFCFICLLHLANEQGLKLEDEQMRERERDEAEKITAVNVGSIWDLKVSRDTTLDDPDDS